MAREECACVVILNKVLDREVGARHVRAEAAAEVPRLRRVGVGWLAVYGRCGEVYRAATLAGIARRQEKVRILRRLIAASGRRQEVVYELPARERAVGRLRDAVEQRARVLTGRAAECARVRQIAGAEETGACVADVCVEAVE